MLKRLVSVFLLFLFSICPFFVFVSADYVGVVGSNIRSDGEHIFMTMEDGVLPDFYSLSLGLTATLDSNSSLEGKYSLNLSTPGTLETFFMMKKFNPNIQPSGFSFKTMIDSNTTDSKTTYAIEQLGVGFLFRISFLNNGSMQLGSLATGYFSNKWEYNTVMDVSFTDINYITHTFSVTVSNASSSESKTLQSFIAVSSNHGFKYFEIFGNDNAPTCIFLDDWTVGTQTVLSNTFSSSSIYPCNATINGELINDGSPYQNASQSNHTTKIIYDAKSHPDFEYITENNSIDTVHLCTDNTYLYCVQGHAIEKRWTSNLSFITSAGSYTVAGYTNNTFAYPQGIVTDGTYIWVSVYNSTDHGRLFKRWASNLTYISMVETNPLRDITFDGTFLYTTSTNRYISKYFANNLTLVKQTQFSTDVYAINSLTVGGIYLYVINPTFTGNQENILTIDKVSLSIVSTTTISTDEYFSLKDIYTNESSAYLWNTYTYYNGVLEYSRLQQRNKKDLTLIDNFDLTNNTGNFNLEYFTMDNDSIYVYDANQIAPFNVNLRKYYLLFNNSYVYSSTVIGTYYGNTDDTDLFNIQLTGLTPGQIYYYRIYLNNSYINSTSFSITDESYLFTTPEAPTNTAYTFVNTTEINLSWVKGTGANTTVVVKKTTGFPTSITDGIIVYNGTGTYFNQPLALNQGTYYRAWSYTGWSNPTLYQLSNNYTNFNTGGLSILCFDENTSLPIANWGVLISNQTKTQTYVNYSGSNPVIINMSDLPSGINSMIKINATWYKFRMYYMNLSSNSYAVVYAYLPLANDTNSYMIRIINQNEYPITNAKVWVKRYINATVGYANVSILITDGNGYCSIDLIPNVDYAVYIEADSYISQTFDLQPVTVTYMEDRYHTYRLTATNPDFVLVSPYSEVITFNGYASGTTVTVNFSDLTGLTTDVNIVVYEHDRITGNYTQVGWYNTTLTNFTVSNTMMGFTRNSSNDYQVTMYHNHSFFKMTYSNGFFINASISALTSRNEFDNIFTGVFGTNAFTWSGIVGVIVLMVCLFSFGELHVGIGLILTGFTMGGINYALGIAFLNMTVCTLIVILGVFVQWQISRRRSGE